MRIRKWQGSSKGLLIVEVLLVFAIANASLRLSPSGMSSLFRITSPLFVVLLFIQKAQDYMRSLIFFFSMIIYSLIVSKIYYNNVAYEYYIFMLYIYFVYVLIKYYSDKVDNFQEEFFSYIDKVTIITLFLCGVQYFIRIPYPYTTELYEHEVVVYMWNANELAVPLACMLILYTYRVMFERAKRDLWKIIVIIFILYINEAKLSIIGAVVGVGGLLLYKNRNESKKKNQIGPVAYTLLLIFLFIGFIVAIYIINPQLKFRDYNITLNELLLNNILDIVRLKPTYGSGGSLVDRTNAIIFGIIELINSHMLGIGIGNSVYMLSLPKYTLLTAESMHNFIFQMITEMGLFCICVLIQIIRWAIKNIRQIGHSNVAILKIVFGIAFIFISSQSSIGIMSNYYMWIIVFYVLLLSTNQKNCNLETLVNCCNKRNDVC